MDYYFKYRLELNNSYMEFMVTDTVHSAERTELYAENQEELGALLFRLRTIMEENRIQYFECYLPATNVNYQRVFLDLDFQIFGYAPAWRANDDGKLEDCVVLGYSVESLNTNQLRLSKAGEKLWNVLHEYFI